MSKNFTLATTPLLRLALLGDAAASGATGLLLTAAAGPLGPLLNLPEPLMRGAGLALLPYAALIAWLGSRLTLRRGVVRAVIAANLLWVAESFLLLTAGSISPTALGVGFLLAQALVVLGFAAAQGLALRRATIGAMPTYA